MNRFHPSSKFLYSLRSSLVIAEKDARIYYIKPPVIIFGILFPLFFFLAFALGKKVSPLILVPGLVAMTLFFTSSSVGPLVIPWERTARTYERLLTTPVSLFSWNSDIGGSSFYRISLFWCKGYPSFSSYRRYATFLFLLFLSGNSFILPCYRGSFPGDDALCSG